MARKSRTLTYVGPDPASVGVVPLPAGWPAGNHEDEEGRAAKLAFRFDDAKLPGWGGKPAYTGEAPASQEEDA